MIKIWDKIILYEDVLIKVDFNFDFLFKRYSGLKD